MNLEAGLNFWKFLPREAILCPRLDDLMDLHGHLFGQIPEMHPGELKTARNFVQANGGRFLIFTEPAEIPAEYARLAEEATGLQSRLNEVAGDGAFIEKCRFVAHFHARLIYIHPFYDGNGRTARVVAWGQLNALGDLRSVSDPLLKATQEMHTAFAADYRSAMGAAPQELSHLIRLFLPQNLKLLCPASVSPHSRIPVKYASNPYS